MKERLNLLYSILIKSLWISQDYMSQTIAWYGKVFVLKLRKIWNESWFAGFFIDSFWVLGLFSLLVKRPSRANTLLLSYHMLLHLKTMLFLKKGHPRISTALDSCVYNHNFKLYIRFFSFLMRSLEIPLLRVVIYCGLKIPPLLKEQFTSSLTL